MTGFEIEEGSSAQYQKVWLPRALHTKQKLRNPADHEQILKEVTVIGWCFDNGLPCRAYYEALGGPRHAAVYGYGPSVYLVEDED